MPMIAPLPPPPTVAIAHQHHAVPQMRTVPRGTPTGEADIAPPADRPSPGPAPSHVAGPADPDRVSGPWVAVTAAQLVERDKAFGGLLRDAVRHSVRVTVDYDADGRADVAELVETRRRAGIRVTFGGQPVHRSRIVFSMTGRWGREEIVADGHHRIRLVKPELGSSLFLRRGGRDLVVHQGD